MSHLTRRQMLRSSASGFGYLAFAAMAAKAAALETKTDDKHFSSPLLPKPPHFAPKAKRVIFLFMQGAPSQVDTFDYKPQLAKSDGQSAARGKLMKSPWNFKQYGECGLWVSDLFPNVGKHADDLCVINSMRTDNPAHPQATIQLHTGTAQFVRPSMGSWILYGLGTQNANLPGFMVINPQSQGGGAQNYGSGFLPATYQGTKVDGEQFIPNVSTHLVNSQQRRQIDLLQSMNRDMLERSGENTQIEGLIESYELGFRMQSSVPQVMDISKETKATLDLYGIGNESGGGYSSRRALAGGGNAAGGGSFGKQCLMARRLIEAGVRFVEVTHGNWDQHFALKAKHESNARETDKPIAGLLTDLKQRGLLKDTLVIWGGEFGRTPSAQNGDGRDHNNRGYTMWMAGGGVKGGLRFGSTDELGARAETNPVHVHDLHATILNLLGLDHEKLTYRYAGRDFRLTDVYGNVVKGIMA